MQTAAIVIIILILICLVIMIFALTHACDQTSPDEEIRLLHLQMEEKRKKEAERKKRKDDWNYP